MKGKGRKARSHNTGGTSIINNSKIKYIKIFDKCYKVKDISFFDLTVQAAETDYFITDIPENEVFDISELKEFKITVINKMGQAEVIDFVKWKEVKKHMK